MQTLISFKLYYMEAKKAKFEPYKQLNAQFMQFEFKIFDISCSKFYVSQD